MVTKNYIYRSYSMEYGTFVGLSWSALFLSYVEGISYSNVLLILLCLLLCVVGLLLPFILGVRLNRKVFATGEKLSYMQGLFFALSMFMYTSLMNGLIVFVYFRFWDNGLLYEQVNSMLTMPEMVTTYQQLGMGMQYEQMMQMVDELDNMSAFDKTLLIFNNNFFFGLIMSFLVAVVASYDLNRLQKRQKE